MKKSELRRLVAKYMELAAKQKKNAGSTRLAGKQKEIECRYFHETGRVLKSDLKGVE